LKDIYICQVKRPFAITTKNGRKHLAFYKQRILTSNGFVRVDRLGINAELITFDHNPYMNRQYGFRKYSLGYLRLRAFLRNHLIEFEEVGDVGTKVGDTTFYCVDYDVEEPIISGNDITLGLNNYREFLMKMFGVGLFSTDTVVNIKQRAATKYILGIVVEDGPQNLIVQNGLVFTTQQGVSND